RSAIQDWQWLGGLLMVVGAYLIWYLIAGPYTEVPADLYRHLEFTKYQFELISNGSFGPPLSLWQLATQQGGFWYVLVAFAAHVTDTGLIDVIYPVMLINGTVFLLGVYVFSNQLFQTLSLSTVQMRIAAVLTCAFVVIQMGVTAFSFVRYYSMAPGILNMVVLFAAQVCMMNLVGLGQNQAHRVPSMSRGLSGLLLILCFGVALAMHNQEGLFILTMAVVLSVLMVFFRIKDRVIEAAKVNWISLGVLFFAVVSGLVFLLLTFDQAPVPQSRNHKVIALPFSLPSYGPLYILNPKYQFAEVVTVWGILVSLLFVIWIRFFKRQPLLVVGMLVPFVTVFNPIFVDVFLRIKDDHSLWRLCFLMPLYPVAALFITKCAGEWLRYSFKRKVAIFVTILMLFVLPFSPRLNPHVRISNLAVAESNSYQLWQDLLNELNSFDQAERVLTDPVTGYVISALTPHITFRYKFFASDLYHAFPFVFDSYDEFPLARYWNWLLVVNRRDGAASESGSRSGHWPENIMKVSKYYPANLISHLDGNPDLFELIWQQDTISIYRINQ
ncbi:MAG: hypothetical protein ACR2QW_00130, partial [bacterium]